MKISLRNFDFQKNNCKYQSTAFRTKHQAKKTKLFVLIHNFQIYIWEK